MDVVDSISNLVSGFVESQGLDGDDQSILGRLEDAKSALLEVIGELEIRNQAKARTSGEASEGVPANTEQTMS